MENLLENPNNILHRVRTIVFKRGHKLIAEFSAPNRLSTTSSTRGITRLNHEALNHAMEDVAIVVAILSMNTKVLNRLWTLLAKQFQVNVTLGCMNNRVVEYLLRLCKKQIELELIILTYSQEITLNHHLLMQMSSTIKKSQY